MESDEPLESAPAPNAADPASPRTGDAGALIATGAGAAIGGALWRAGEEFYDSMRKKAHARHKKSDEDSASQSGNSDSKKSKDDLIPPHFLTLKPMCREMVGRYGEHQFKVKITYDLVDQLVEAQRDWTQTHGALLERVISGAPVQYTPGTHYILAEGNFRLTAADHNWRFSIHEGRPRSGSWGGD